MSKKVYVKLAADTSDFEKGMKKATRLFKKTAKSLQNTGKSLTRNLTAPILGIGAAALKGAADLERLEASFISLTGGAKQAADMMKQLTDFTAKTPFQIDAVANSARQLIASGTEVSEVNNQLQFLGDIAATSGSRIDEITAIFSKVQSKGKVELESLNQLAERGIPIFSALSEATGLLPSELGAGAVSVEQFNQVLSSFNEQGGFAEGAMNTLSQTMAGKVSTALDNLKLAGADLVQSLLPLIHKFLDSVTGLAQKFTGLSSETKTAILTFGLLVAAIGPVLIITGKLVAVFGLISSALTFLSAGFTTMSFAAVKAWAAAFAPVAAVIAGLAAVGAAVIYLVDNYEAFKERFTSLSWWKNALISMLQFFVDFAANIMGGYNKMLIFFKQTPVNNPFLAMSEGLENLKDETEEYENEFGSFADAISNAATKAKNALFGVAGNIGLDSSKSSSGSGEEPVKIHAELVIDDASFEEEEEFIDTSYGEKLIAMQERLQSLKNMTQELGYTLAESLSSGFASAVTSGESFMTSFVEIFKNIAKQIVGMIVKAMVLAALFTYLGIGDANGMSKTAGFFKNFETSLTGKASGGAVVSGQPYMVGESGPEMFMPGQSGTIIPNQNVGGGSIIPDVRITGDDLLIVFDKANRRKDRR